MRLRLAEPMRTSRILLGTAFAVCTTALVTGCSNTKDEDSPTDSITRGTLIQNPPLRTGSVNATDLSTQFSQASGGLALLAVAGSPDCGIDYHSIEYTTVGGAGEPTTATGVLMVPTGSAAPCTGPRPIVLYGHGTSAAKTYNLAAVSDTSNPSYGERILLAAMFAAQGYIVVAPNYAGYDASTLSYHPYLNADQQSKDMIDALTAARSALGHIVAAGTTDSGKLFVAGYSQGGYVAMATQRALEALGQTVTASVPMSGPYALEAMGDTIMLGTASFGVTAFIPLTTSSYQNSYGDLYNSPSEFYEDPYAAWADSLLPSTTPLGTLADEGKLPRLALFSRNTPVTGNATLDSALAVPADPLFAQAFGTGNLIGNSARVAYVADVLASPDGAVPAFAQSGVPLAANPTYPLRVKLNLNDMRKGGFVPRAPTLLCGGSEDPTVFFDLNTRTMEAFWASLNVPVGRVTALDLETGLGAGDPYESAQQGFDIAKTALAIQAVLEGATDGGAAAVADSYHSGLVPAFCMVAARQFFGQFQ
jgi:pimeloyl-ACP methyl ester carboxylesterase